MYDFYKKQYANDGLENDSDTFIRNHITAQYGYGSPNGPVEIPNYPDWDQAQWCIEQSLQNKGNEPNDYINSFISQDCNNDSGFTDESIVGGSNAQFTGEAGLNKDGEVPTKLKNFINTDSYGFEAHSNVAFNYISKKISFNRVDYPWLIDYKVDVNLVNCLAQNTAGTFGEWDKYMKNDAYPATYFGHWIEKGFDYFIIYVAFVADDSNNLGSLQHANTGAGYPAPNTAGVSERDGGRFSGFIVPVSDLLTSNTNPISIGGPGGYAGNPRVGKCTYPTIMWNMIGIPDNDAAYFNGGNANMQQTDPLIVLKDL